MKTVLEARRQKLLREISRIDRQIAQAQKDLARVESRKVPAGKVKDKAA